jgi:hypothetical protein
MVVGESIVLGGIDRKVFGFVLSETVSFVVLGVCYRRRCGILLGQGQGSWIRKSVVASRKELLYFDMVVVLMYW